MNVVYSRCGKSVCALLSLLFFVVMIGSANAEPSNLVSKRGAEEIRLIHHDVSKPLREIAPSETPSGVMRIHSVKMLPPLAPDPNAPVTAGGIDPGLQTWDGPIAMPTPITSWDGVSANGSAPPDTNGDTGPNHFVQTVNTKYAIYNKTGSLLLGPSNINTLWTGFGGGCQTNNDGDPTVMYDQLNDRWIISQFSVSTTPYMQCIAVSTTGDPTGSYNRFSYSYGTGFNDYPKMGMWNGDYYITYNMFAGGISFTGGKVCAYQGSKLRAGQVNTMQCFDETGGGLLAADMDGSALPPAGAPEYVMSFGTNLLNVWKMKIDWVTPGNSTFTKTTISVTAFSEACGGGTCITQPGTTQKLDSLADRMMNRLSYRNRAGVESFLLTHSVTASTVSGIRWYELRSNNSATTTPTLFQQGTYSPTADHRWMGSIAMDKDGNIAVGYSVSSGTVKPSIRYAGRLAGDAAGTLAQGEAEMTAGGGVQTGGLSRWGDYSDMTLDPSDDCTMFYTTEYLAANGSFNWKTRIGKFKFATCGSVVDTTPPTTSLTAPAAGNVSGTIAVSANANDNIGVTKVEFYAGATLIGTDFDTAYSINWNTTTVPNGPYTLTSKAYDAANNTGTSTGVNVTVNNPVTCGASSQLLLNPGFESGAVNWTQSKNGLINNNPSRPANSGTWKVTLNGLGTSSNQNILQAITIPANACTASLTFWVRIDTADTTTTSHDLFRVQIGTQGSGGWNYATKATYSNLNANSIYVQKTFDLASYKGQTIRVRLRGTEDASLQTTFVVDDTAVNITQ